MHVHYTQYHTHNILACKHQFAHTVYLTHEPLFELVIYAHAKLCASVVHLDIDMHETYKFSIAIATTS